MMIKNISNNNIPKVSDRYKDDYFDWQKNIGEFGVWANLFRFNKFIKKTDTAIDFGCGFLLKNINCKNKIGIEPNK